MANAPYCFSPDEARDIYDTLVAYLDADPEPSVRERFVERFRLARTTEIRAWSSSANPEEIWLSAFPDGPPRVMVGLAHFATERGAAIEECNRALAHEVAALSREPQRPQIRVRPSALSERSSG